MMNFLVLQNHRLSWTDDVPALVADRGRPLPRMDAGLGCYSCGEVRQGCYDLNRDILPC